MNDTDKKRLEEIEAALAATEKTVLDARPWDENSVYQIARYLRKNEGFWDEQDFGEYPGESDAGFVANSRDYVRFLISRLKDAMERESRVRELHKPYGIYDECSHDHKSDNEPGVVDASDIGFTCAKMYDVCEACCAQGRDGQSEECASGHDHGPGKPICPTIAILDGGEG